MAVATHRPTYYIQYGNEVASSSVRTNVTVTSSLGSSHFLFSTHFGIHKPVENSNIYIYIYIYLHRTAISIRLPTQVMTYIVS
jgi:hypothetical protein